MNEAVLWPRARAGEVLTLVAQAAGFGPRAVDLGSPPPEERDGIELLVPWLEEAGAWLGVEVESVVTAHHRLERALVVAAPAIVHVANSGLLAVIGRKRDQLIVIDPSLRTVRVPATAVRDAICSHNAAQIAEEAGATLAQTGLAGEARRRAIDAIIAARLHHRRFAGIHLLRLPPDASPRLQAHDARLGRKTAALIALHLIAQALWLGSWWALGQSILSGTVSSAWLAGWGLLFGSAQVARVASRWLQSRIAIDISALLSRRLMAGALRSDPDLVKSDGVGVALGRVFDSHAVQTLAVGGGLQAALSSIEIMLAFVVLALGAGGALHVVLLLAMLTIAGFATRTYLRQRKAWTGQRLELTYALVESMVGHATQLAQGDRAELDERNDRGFVRYVVQSRNMDRAQWRLTVLVPGAWPLIAAAGLGPALLFGSPSAGMLGAAIGGVLFASQAMVRFVDGVVRVADAAIAWRSVGALFAAAEAVPEAAPPGLALAPPSPDAPPLTVRGLGYRHAGRGAPVLSGCDLIVARGEHVLLVGPSGAGKSTFAAIAAGIRRGSEGLVLAGGLDRGTVGARGWRRRVTCAPQFHENHVFNHTLAFNLLMGRAWPPRPEGLAAAEDVCRELGLGDLLDRMPRGLHQPLGETGWQLSHGERSRLFLARALLQQAELVVLDESLAALDPQTLAISIACIEARAPAAILIAHP